MCSTISEKIQEKNSFLELAFNFGMVAYRDYGDDDRHICPCPFAHGPDQLREFLSKQKPGGGQDPAEDVLGGLNAAVELDGWSSRVKFCILIADDPGHGNDLHTSEIADR